MRWEQLWALDVIYRCLDRARGELDYAKSKAHEMRNGVDKDSPFSRDDLDYDLCVAVEKLCDDVRTAQKTIKGMYDELDEEEVE